MKSIKFLKNQKALLILPVFATALLTALLVTSCSSGKISELTAKGSADVTEPVSRTGFYFDTVITVTVYADASTAEGLLDGCMEIADRAEKHLFSKTAKGSDISRVNMVAGSGVAVPVEPETAELIKASLLWSERTDGAFSPVLGALTGLWNFTGDPPGPVPADDDIAEALAHISTDSVILSDAEPFSVSVSDSLTGLDLGGIAKGYIADMMKDYLRENGTESAVINLGGNVLLLGSKPDGSDFRVGIQDPDAAAGQAVIATVAAADRSIVTSGVYERYFEQDGKRYHHILDPSTGRPADSGLISVTVISDSSADGDALATACLVMGQEKGRALIESLAGFEAMFIDDAGAVTCTEGFPPIR